MHWPNKLNLTKYYKLGIRIQTIVGGWIDPEEEAAVEGTRTSMARAHRPAARTSPISVGVETPAAVDFAIRMVGEADREVTKRWGEEEE